MVGGLNMIMLRLCYNTCKNGGDTGLYPDDEVGIKVIYKTLSNYKSIYGDLPSIYTISEQLRLNGYISGGDQRFSPRDNCWVKYEWSISKESVEENPESSYREHIINKLVEDYRRHLEHLI